MPAVSLGDYSKYPEPLRDVLPYLHGEVCDIRGCWVAYKRLFMESEERVKALGTRLGGLLAQYRLFFKMTCWSVFAD